MTKDEALKLALEALERSVATCFDQRSHYEVMGRPEHFVNKAIIAIKDALAQPEQEPVYTHPVKDLEDIDINITWNENSMRDFGKDELNFARAILRKAKEK